ncbi:hypothetical protein L9F63_022720, partial [Diploptera punctata]
FNCLFILLDDTVLPSAAAIICASQRQPIDNPSLYNDIKKESIAVGTAQPKSQNILY